VAHEYILSICDYLCVYEGVSHPHGKIDSKLGRKIPPEATGMNRVQAPLHRARQAMPTLATAEMLEEEVRATEERLIQLKIQMRESKERFDAKPYGFFVLTCAFARLHFC
jgi:hypothetical protein